MGVAPGSASRTPTTPVATIPITTTMPVTIPAM
jgi:hypothetical protein